MKLRSNYDTLHSGKKLTGWAAVFGLALGSWIEGLSPAAPLEAKKRPAGLLNDSSVSPEEIEK